jgi:hypothetical protein
MPAARSTSTAMCSRPPRCSCRGSEEEEVWGAGAGDDAADNDDAADADERDEKSRRADMPLRSNSRVAALAAAVAARAVAVMEVDGCRIGTEIPNSDER